MVEEVVLEEQISISRACKLLGISKSNYYYKSRKDDSAVIEKLQECVERKPQRGFWNYYQRIRNEGIPWNHKRVKRVYDQLGLNLRRKHKKRLPDRIKEPLEAPEALNQVWSMDFMCDSLTTGRKIRIFNVVDDFNREALAIEVDFSFPAEKVVRKMQEIIDWRGKPDCVRVDNGPEFISNCFVEYCNKLEIKIKYIQPGKPMQNAYVERFNRLFREDILDAYLFESIKQVKILTEEFYEDYNKNHPHDSLGGISPRAKLLTVENSPSLPQLTVGYNNSSF